MGTQALNRIIFGAELALPWPQPPAQIRAAAPSLTHAQFTHSYSRVTRGFYLPTTLERPVSQREHGQRVNRWGFDYRHHMISRIRARALATPRTTFTAWSALRILGLPFWTNDLPVSVASNRTATSPRSPLDAHVLRTSSSRNSNIPVPTAPRSLWQPEFLDLPHSVDCVSLTEAACQALQQVLRGTVRWWLPDPLWLFQHTDFSPEELCALQLLDSCLRYSNLQLTALLKHCHQRISRRALHRLAAAASPGADSPAETLLRLVLRPLLPDIEAQVPILQDVDPHALITTADLFCRRNRIAVFYDGGHHDVPQQRQRDAAIDRQLQRRGIRPLRFTAQELRNPQRLLTEVAAFLA